MSICNDCGRPVLSVLEHLHYVDDRLVMLCRGCHAKRSGKPAPPRPPHNRVLLTDEIVEMVRDGVRVAGSLGRLNLILGYSRDSGVIENLLRHEVRTITKTTLERLKGFLKGLEQKPIEGQAGESTAGLQ